MPAGVGTSLIVYALNGGTALSTRLCSGLSLGLAVLASFMVAAIAGILAGDSWDVSIAANRLQRGAALLFAVVALDTGACSNPDDAELTAMLGWTGKGGRCGLSSAGG